MCRNPMLTFDNMLMPRNSAAGTRSSLYSHAARRRSAARESTDTSSVATGVFTSKATGK